MAELTADEAALYDRQIRLWGLETQQRLRRVKILIAGLNGMHNEVLKNLVLGGVGSITVMDDKLVNQKDLQAQFLLNDKCSVGKNRAEAILPALMDLNPKVSVSALTGNLMDKPRDFFEQFDIVSVSDYGYQQMIQLDRQCREVGVKFYASDATCGGAWVFCDAGQHSYQKSVKSADGSESKQSTVIHWPSMLESLNDHRPWKGMKNKRRLRKILSPIYLFFRLALEFERLHSRLPSSEADISDLFNICIDFLPSELEVEHDILSNDSLRSIINGCNGNADLSGINAIAGGILAQDIIRCVSATESPLANYFFFNSADMSGLIQAVGFSHSASS